MAYSRRRFLYWAAVVSAIGVPRRAAAAAPTGYRPKFLPSQREVWEQQTWMAKLGPRYTGNRAHVEFVEFLATTMKQLGLEVSRDRYTFPRWDARRWSIAIAPAGAPAFQPHVTSYFPYSGQTTAAGVTGELVFAGRNPTLALDNLQGRSRSSSARSTRGSSLSSINPGPCIRLATRSPSKPARRAGRSPT